jgi:hypothetical protein
MPPDLRRAPAKPWRGSIAALSRFPVSTALRLQAVEACRARTRYRTSGEPAC